MRTIEEQKVIDCFSYEVSKGKELKGVVDALYDNPQLDNDIVTKVLEEAIKHGSTK